MSRFCVVIPARYASSRFPGKLLKMIGRKSIIQHVYDRCIDSKLVSKVIVATDHELIFNHCKENNLDVIMTGKQHISGTDRVAEAIKLIGGDFDYVINVQGDEPMITSKEINSLINVMRSKTAEIATLYRESGSIRPNPNSVKLVINKNKKVLYFSRSSIPFDRTGTLKVQKHHIGIYGFRSAILQQLTDLQPSFLEKTEMLEQLRWLENGYEIYANEVDYKGFGIDVEDDLIRARKIMLGE